MTDGRMLLLQALAGLAFLIIVMALCIFLPAGTTHYPAAWGFLAVFAIASLAITLDLYRNDRGLLARRTQGGPGAEGRASQKLIQAVASVAFLATLVVPGFDRRWGWSHLAPSVAIAGDALAALGFWLVSRVFQANSFTSATVKVDVGQTVVTTGPYAIVRHPMYASMLVLLAGIPLALRSALGLLASLVVAGVIVARLLDEEAVLKRDLPGYAAYCETMRYRLIPYVW